MSDFTPTTSSVRDRYAACRIPKGVRATVAKEEFDRWLAEHDEKVRAETLREFASDLNDAMRRGVVDPAKFAELSADRIEKGGRTMAVDRMGPAAGCAYCVGAGGYEDYDGEWRECSCQPTESKKEVRCEQER